MGLNAHCPSLALTVVGGCQATSPARLQQNARSPGGLKPRSGITPSRESLQRYGRVQLYALLLPLKSVRL